MSHETEPNSVAAVEKPPKPKKPPGYRKFQKLLKQVIKSAS